MNANFVSSFLHLDLTASAVEEKFWLYTSLRNEIPDLGQQNANTISLYYLQWPVYFNEHNDIMLIWCQVCSYYYKYD